MKFNYTKALVTGGAGFIGSHLVDAILALGCRVTVIDDLSTGRLVNIERVLSSIRFVEGSICAPELLDEAMAGCDIVFHQAAVVSVPKTVAEPTASAEVNELGTLQVLEAARRNHAKKVILASSSAVYGDTPELPKHENQPPSPQSPYAVQKLTGELYACLYHQLHGLATVCLRYFNVYGPRQDSSSPYSGVISIFMKCAANGQQPTIFGDGRQYRDFIFIQDVVRANLLAAGSDAANGMTFNVGTERSTSVLDLWHRISELSQSRLAPVLEPVRPGDINASLASIDLAKAKMDFEPSVDFEKGLELTYEWYKKQHLKFTARNLN